MIVNFVNPLSVKQDPWQTRVYQQRLGGSGAASELNSRSYMPQGVDYQSRAQGPSVDQRQRPDVPVQVDAGVYVNVPAESVPDTTDKSSSYSWLWLLLIAGGVYKATSK